MEQEIWVQALLAARLAEGRSGARRDPHGQSRCKTPGPQQLIISLSCLPGCYVGTGGYLLRYEIR